MSATCEPVAQPIARLAVIGVGLIGGSLARALRAVGACREVVGCGRDREHLARAVELGVVDAYETDPVRAVRGAEMVVVTVPLGAMESVFRSLRSGLEPGAILTDGGSAKCSVIRAARTVFGETPAFLVPAHPIAGTEKSGVEASFGELYRNRRVILTPTALTDRRAVARVRWMWEQAGAEVVEMDCAHHDRVLADTSHLPHMLAYTLVDTLARKEDKTEIFHYAAGGFRDFTRIASSDPRMWHDICLANRDALLDSVEDFSADLARLSQAIRAGDSEAMLSVFTRAKQARDRFAED